MSNGDARALSYRLADLVIFGFRVFVFRAGLQSFGAVVGAEGACLNRAVRDVDCACADFKTRGVARDCAARDVERAVDVREENALAVEFAARARDRALINVERAAVVIV